MAGDLLLRFDHGRVWSASLKVLGFPLAPITTQEQVRRVMAHLEHQTCKGK